MRILLLFLLCLPAWAAPHLDLNLHLDPDHGTLAADASLDLQADHFDLALLPTLKLTRIAIDGKALPRSGDLHLQLAAGRTHRIELAYQGRLPSLANLDQREVLARLDPMTSPQGSFLPAASGWYPDPGVPFSYRVRLSLPAGQKGLVPGTLVRESSRDGYHAEYVFAQQAEGIDLLAGPYVVQERLIARPGRPPLRLRTWFYADMTDLAPGYLEDTARYIARYSKQIGDYPFDDFSVVASPLPTGFAMPSLTYLGRDVLRLPFIRATSLGHEVLHNWWGNGVIPDYATGNWSEGLTTFMADYAYQEEQSQDAARQARLAWLRDLAAVPQAQETPLADFTARHHGISSIIGYDKAAMVFLMLRDRIGVEAFDRGLRLFWQRHHSQRAGWADLEHDFAEASGQGLADFFGQWVQQAGSPELKLSQAHWSGGRLDLTLEQSGAPYDLRVPLRLWIYPGQVESHTLEVKQAMTHVSLPVAKRVQAVDLDPDYRVWRRVAQDRFPPILREVFVAPRVGLVAPDAALSQEADALAERLLDAHPVDAAGFPGPRLIIGLTRQIDALLLTLGLPPPPTQVAVPGSARVWAGRDESGRPYAVIAAENREALRALQRPLPHYGRQSWLVFDAARVLDKGIWPPLPERVGVKADAEFNRD